jgi:uncharacterized protein with von Willebrand factor type A (vWA) domain
VFERAFAALFPAPAASRGASSPAAAAPTATGTAADALAEALLADDDAAVDVLLNEAVERWAGLADGRSAEHHTQRVLRRLDLGRVLQQVLRAAADGDGYERRLAAGDADADLDAVRARLEQLVAAGLGASDATPTESVRPLDDTPLLRASPDELAALRAAVRPLARRLASRLGRKRRRQSRGAVDMRRTLRRSMGSGGVPLEPELRRRHAVKPDLVVLCDVSGSTAQFAPFTLALLHAMHQEFNRVRSYVFVDGIVEITALLQSASGVLDARHLLDRRGLVAGDGRSDYARALAAFRSRWPDVVTPKTTVIVAGDARSHDRPPATAAVAEIARAARRLYWLDPEPRVEWSTADSRLDAYAPHCTAIFEVATLRQLADAVAAIA